MLSSQEFSVSFDLYIRLSAKTDQLTVFKTVRQKGEQISGVFRFKCCSVPDVVRN